MADTFFVGNLGNSASGAVGIVFGLMAILQAVGFMFGHGAGSIIARKLGEKDIKSAELYASVSFFMAIISGTLMGIIGLAFIEPFMKLLGSTHTILPYAKGYAMFILMAAPIMMASFVMNNILRYEGKAYLAMIGLTAGAAINILLDPILIFKFNMGIKGAGLSTALSQFVSFLILLSMFLRGRTQSRLCLSYMKGDIRFPISNIVKTGLPSLIRQGLNGTSTMVLNGLAGAFGDAAVAAMSIVNRICFFIFAVALGIGQGFQPVSAFNYGAKNYSRVKKAFGFTFIMGEMILGLLAIVGYFLSGELVGLFRDDIEVIQIGTVALRFQLAALFFQPLTICSNMLFQSIGEHVKASFLSMLRSGLIYIPVILLMSYFFGLTGIQMSQTIADILACLVTLPIVAGFLRKLPKDE